MKKEINIDEILTKQLLTDNKVLNSFEVLIIYENKIGTL